MDVAQYYFLRALPVQDNFCPVQPSVPTSLGLYSLACVDDVSLIQERSVSGHGYVSMGLAPRNLAAMISFELRDHIPQFRHDSPAKQTAANEKAGITFLRFSFKGCLFGSMNNKKSALRATLKVTLALALLIWIAGGVLAGLYNNLYEKKQCIENEGWLKGVFRCSTGSASHFAANMFSGFLWPGLIFYTPKPESESDDVKKMQEVFTKTSIGTLYTCWGGALNSNREDDANTLLRVIEWMKQNNETNRKGHIAFAVMASKVVVSLDESGTLESYYHSKCEEPIKKLRRYIEQGLLDNDSLRDL